MDPIQKRAFEELRQEKLVQACGELLMQMSRAALESLTNVPTGSGREIALQKYVQGIERLSAALERLQDIDDNNQ
jgi:hypothetical protein